MISESKHTYFVLIYKIRLGINLQTFFTMSKLTPKAERLLSICNYLKFKGIAKTNTELAAKAGYTKGSLSAILNGHQEASDAMIKSFCILDAGVNLDWGLTGEGEMLLDGSSVAAAPQPVSPMPDTNGALVKALSELQAEVDLLRALCAEKDRSLRIYAQWAASLGESCIDKYGD